MIQTHDRDFLAPERLMALTDGVFAIAMTLLALSIEVPNAADVSGGADLRNHLRGLFPQLFNYLLSFLLLGRIWINLHRLGHDVRRTDDLHVWLHVFMLMLVCLVPFSASLDAGYGGDAVAAAIFHGNLLCVGLALCALWFHATRRRRLVDPALPAAAVAAAWRRLLLLPAVALAALLLAPVLPFNSSWLYLLVPPLRRFAR